ncbi:NADPH-dependent FMN reductase [Microbacterium aurantiacum]|uniref:NADPH-dependent FMN reductase n=1 Tax=Microbacterium aurantiacum TaxID=162393 RepID=UPI003421BA42
MSLRIVTLVGNPQPSSRTARVAEEVAAQIAERAGAEVLPTIDLADYADRIFVFPEPEVDALGDEVATADLVVVASPTYKAAYTGLLKAFLDRYGSGGLDGVIAIPILTIGSPAHALAVEHTLRPLLVELGATVPSRGLAFPAASTEDRERIVADWLGTQWSRIGPLL